MIFLDKTSTSEILGKNTKQDEKNDKITVVDILGIEKSKEYISNLQEEAINFIEKYGKRADNLKDMCLYLTGRIN